MLAAPNDALENTDPGTRRRVAGQAQPLPRKSKLPYRFTAAIIATACVMAQPFLPYQVPESTMDLVLGLWGFFIAGDSWRPTGMSHRTDAALGAA